MSKIKFDDVMNFYPKHNLSIYKMIVEAQKSGSLIPFIGAGMSVFCGYKLWGDVLSELAEFILIEDERQAALKQIDNGAYEEAAEMILEAYPAMLDQLPDMISPNKLKACTQEKLQSSAAFTLPYLFQKGLVITTNFDRVLETVYLSHGSRHIEIVTPNQQDRLAQLRQSQTFGLFKLHGDIGSDTMSIDDLVFTGKQYEEKYADGSPLVQELTRWFENRRLLFLGCSLNVDRTMEVLKRVVKAQPGIRHYAVLDCKKSDIPKRLRELRNLGILPIFYDDSDHDAVRIILERLLEETDQESYKNLQASSRIASVATKEEGRLLFDADYFPFTGRRMEMESLEAFCAGDDGISWWAVTGPGGMGKSRLVYEFANQQREDCWRIERFEAYPSKGSHARSIEDLGTWNPGTSRTIVILDNVQAHMELVMQWLNKVVRSPRSEKLRILLLEREGKNLKSSYWLRAGTYGNIPAQWCYRENFLCLKPMTNADLISIMDGYAKAAGKKLNAELLLGTLERVDPNLKRPLYALAIADASCQGRDPTDWDRKKVLDALLNRELDFLFYRFQGMTGERLTQKISSELKELLAYSCVCGYLFMDNAEMNLYPTLTKIMDSLNMGLQEFLEGLGILHTVLFRMVKMDQSGNPIGEPYDEIQKVISLSCPDLIKEHLVLNLVLEEDKRDLLFPQNWEQEPRRLQFLEELLADYSDRLREQSDLWKAFFQATPQNVFSANIYGRILWGYAAEYSDSARVAIDRLVRLYVEMNHAPEIAGAYAKGLVNLSAGQDLKECMETVAQLDALYQTHPNISDVAEAYAEGLFNLSTSQDLKGCMKTVAQLDAVYKAYPDIPKVAEAYAEVLFNLSTCQDLKGCMETVAQLDALYQTHPDIPKVVEAYAKGLVNVIVGQDIEGRKEVIAQLNTLYQTHFNIPEIAVVYASGLINVTFGQDLECRTEVIAQLSALYQTHPDIPEIAGTYAKGLFNLTFGQDLEGCTEIVAQLDVLYQTHPDIPEIPEAYARGLYSLILMQDLKGRAETVVRLEELYQNHPDTLEIADAYVKGLIALAVIQDLKGRTETILRLDKLYQSHPDILEIADAYTQGLVALTSVQDLKGCTETITRLNELYQNHPDIPRIAVAYAQGLVNLTIHQDSKGRKETVARLAALCQAHPHIPEIANAYVMGFFNSSET